MNVLDRTPKNCSSCTITITELFSRKLLTFWIDAVGVLQDLMSGKVIYRNMMSILMVGVNSVMEQRTSQLYGPALEDSISLCLQILRLALSKDILFAEAWRPVYQAFPYLHSFWLSVEYQLWYISHVHTEILSRVLSNWNGLSPKSVWLMKCLHI